MAIEPVNPPIFVVQVGDNGQLTVSQVVAGDLSSATLAQLYSGQRDIPAVTKLVEAMIFRNLT